jgi:hypothetical protein
MAYSQNNPPCMIGAGTLTGYNSTEAPAAPRVWTYASADPIATVQGAGYISDGIQRGLQINDLVIVVDTNLGRMYLTMVVTRTPVAAATNSFQGAGLGSVTLSSTTTPLID